MEISTPDQIRRRIRKALHMERCVDGDHGEERMWRDAAALDAALHVAGAYQYRTWWGTRPKWARAQQPEHLSRDQS